MRNELSRHGKEDQDDDQSSATGIQPATPARPNSS